MSIISCYSIIIIIIVDNKYANLYYNKTEIYIAFNCTTSKALGQQLEVVIAEL